MQEPKKNKKDKKVIEYSVLPEEKSLELNELLDEIVETLNGMGTNNTDKKKPD